MCKLFFFLEFTLARERQLAECRCSGSFVMKWLRYDTIASTDNRNMNFNETCLDDVKKMMIIRSIEKWRETRMRRV